jgi:thiosulfate/3-mercaptopyruvate sulfurtransferase
MPQTRILMSPTELHGVLEAPGWVILDCRSDLSDLEAGRRAYTESHIPGAVFVDLDRDLAGPVLPETGRHPLPDAGKLGRTLGELGVGNADSVVVYDDSNGALAARAWWILRWLGQTSVFLLDGGISHWRALGFTCETAIPARPARNFVGRPDAAKVLTTAELAADIDNIASLNLLDARDAERFSGAQEPIDPVAGHVPGAVNAPFTRFVSKEGTWRPLAERELLLEEVLGRDREVEWSVMCGSGVTACHLAISGLEAGFREPRLYVGSWSEWIRDPARSIATSNR